jgi:hypothetical protein
MENLAIYVHHEIKAITETYRRNIYERSTLLHSNSFVFIFVISHEQLDIFLSN